MGDAVRNTSRGPSGSHQVTAGAHRAMTAASLRAATSGSQRATTVGSHRAATSGSHRVSASGSHRVTTDRLGHTCPSARLAAAIEQSFRFFYLHPRDVGRRAQLCLRAADGVELGWKDLASGRVVVRDRADGGRLSTAILQAAGSAHEPLPADDLPGVPLDIPSGPLLAQLRLRSAGLLVSKETAAGEGHRLYATLAWPGRSTISLGYADLGTGARHPRVDGARGVHHAALDPGVVDELLAAAVACRPLERYP